MTFEASAACGSVSEATMSPEYEILFGFRAPHPLPTKRKAVTRGDDPVRPTDAQVVAHVVESGVVTTDSLASDLRLDRKGATKILRRLADRGEIARVHPGKGPTLYTPQPEGAERPMTVRRRVLDALQEAVESDADKLAELTGLTPTQVKDAASSLKGERLIYVHKKYKSGSSWIPVWRITPQQ